MSKKLYAKLNNILREKVFCDVCGTRMNPYTGQVANTIDYVCPSCGYIVSSGYGVKQEFYQKENYKQFFDGVFKLPSNILKSYAILGIKSGSTVPEIRIAYKKLVKIWHPDVNPNPEASDMLIKITKAKDDLLRFFEYKNNK